MKNRGKKGIFTQTNCAAHVPRGKPPFKKEIGTGTDHYESRKMRFNLLPINDSPCRDCETDFPRWKWHKISEWDE